MSTQRATARTPHQLPSGRHGLPRTYVSNNQRERILDAVVQVVGSNGYAAFTIEDVISTAGVSRRTFYDHFSNKEQAFLAAYDLIVGHLMGSVRASFGRGTDWVDRIRRGLSTFLESLAQEPLAAHVCIVEILAGGPLALQRRADAMSGFEGFFALEHQVHRPTQPLAAETVIGGLYEVVYSRVLAGQAAELPQLLPELLHSLMLPFVGSDLADVEYHAAHERSSPVEYGVQDA